MRFDNVCVESIGYVLPDEVVTSDDLERQLAPVYERLALPPGRLELMTGVRERRFFPKGSRPSTYAAEAGEVALGAAGFPRDRVGALLHTAVCRDFLEPATATVVHHNLGLPSACAIFDVGNACLGLLNGIGIVGGMIERGEIDAGLLVSAENGRDLVESTVAAMLRDQALTRKGTKPYFASLTIGAAAVAVLLAHRRIATSPHRVLGGIVRAATEHHDLCQGYAGSQGTLMNTDSEALLNRGVDLAEDTWRALCDHMDWRDPAHDVDRVVCHQVGRRHQRAMLERLAIDPAKDSCTFDRLGNVGSAALPITLAIAVESRHVEPGHTVALLGIGSGINCLMLALDW